MVERPRQKHDRSRFQTKIADLGRDRRGQPRCAGEDELGTTGRSADRGRLGNRDNGIGQVGAVVPRCRDLRSEEHTSELQSLMRTSYADFALTKKKLHITTHVTSNNI